MDYLIIFHFINLSLNHLILPVDQQAVILYISFLDKFCRHAILLFREHKQNLHSYGSKTFALNGDFMKKFMS